MKPHSSSIFPQNEKNRDTVAQNPTGSKNQRDSDNSKSLISDKQEDIHLEQEIKVMSLNVEGLSMPKCEYLSRLFKKHDVVCSAPSGNPFDKRQSPFKI